VLQAIVAQGNVDGITLREGLRCTGFSADDPTRTRANFSGLAQERKFCEWTRAKQALPSGRVSSIDWVLWYNWHHLADRIRI
jgi:hypothetical protein